MRMNQDERRFDFHGLGLALKQAREEKGWTQAYVAELVGKTDRTIMNIENKFKGSPVRFCTEQGLSYSFIRNNHPSPQHLVHWSMPSSSETPKNALCVSNQSLTEAFMAVSLSVSCTSKTLSQPLYSHYNISFFCCARMHTSTRSRI